MWLVVQSQLGPAIGPDPAIDALRDGERATAVATAAFVSDDQRIVQLLEAQEEPECLDARRLHPGFAGAGEPELKAGPHIAGPEYFGNHAQVGEASLVGAAIGEEVDEKQARLGLAAVFVGSLPDFVREIDSALEGFQGENCVPGQRELLRVLDRFEVVCCLHTPLLRRLRNVIKFYFVFIYGE